MIFTADDGELDEASARAWEITLTVMADTPIIDWPPLPEPLASLPLANRQAARRLLVEQYVYGVVYCAITTEASFELQGAVLQFPALEQAGAMEHISRLISYETLLPFLNSDVTETQARALAVRLRGLADLCDRYRQPKD